MRTVYPKRPHHGLPTKTDLKYIPFGGGLNVIDSHLTMGEGMLTECMNFEQIFGKQGYSRIGGYERYDGRPEPHNATYFVQEFKQGSIALTAGTIVLGTDSTAEILFVELQSGSWAGGDAAGRLILGNCTGVWEEDEAIKVVSTTHAYSAADTYQGSVSETLNTTYKAIAIEDRRSAISAVPGAGGILGIGVANGIVYAARNAADGLSAVLYKSSASGWTAIKTGLRPNGRFRMIQANFTGSTQYSYLFGCDGINRPWKYDGTTFTFMSPIYGSQATSTSSVAVGTGSKAFTCTETLRSFASGQTITVWSTSNAANYMTGTYVSYTSNILTINVTATGGSGTFTDWEIGLATFADKPYNLLAHKDHLFLAYPYGQLQTSNLGDPMTYTTTAALIGLGASISGMVSMRAGVLAVYCDGKVDLISGTSHTDWVKSTNTGSSGGVIFTPLEVASCVLALDTRGITSLQATLNYGGFEMSVFSRYVKPYLDLMAGLVVDARVVRGKNQYRLYASNGVVLTCTVLTPNAQVTPEEVSFTVANYATEITCVVGGDINGEEHMFFGTSDGYVMREDVGASFDGAPIPSVIRTPFWSFKSPSNKKRFRKLVIEIDTPQLTEISYRQLFDYGDGNYSPSINYDMSAYGGGGQWNVDSWDTFQWSLPVQTQAETNIAGVGRNMSLLLWHESALDDPFSLQGVTVQYSTLGLSR